MGNMNTTHQAAGRARLTVQGPPGQRPQARADQRRPDGRRVEEVLAELASTRIRYEDLRFDSGSLTERARLTSDLHALRAEAAHARQSLGRT